MTNSTKILIMAGGTGGHVFPALAIAEELRARGVRVSWLGTRRGMEAKLVPEAGFAIRFVRISGLRGKGLMRRIGGPFLILMAILQSLWIILRIRPRAVLGMGGFVSGPGGVAAWLLRRPLLIHEQNAVPGMTNRLLARLATRVMEAFPESFLTVPGLAVRCPIEYTGNPVRRDIVLLPPPLERLRSREGVLRILVLGGSQGADILNNLVPAAIGGLPDPARVSVHHQTGRQHIEHTRARYAKSPAAVELFPFIDDMAAAYGWADLVIGRAGAMTVTELAAAGAASILVPYPFAVDDHQMANARFLGNVGAALWIRQSDLSADGLCRLIEEFLEPSGRRRLVAMAQAGRALAVPDAARRVAERCLGADNARSMAS